MSTVIFETDNALFTFALTDVLGLLASYSSERHVEEATALLKGLQSIPGDLRKVPSENRFFGYIALGLLGKGKGSAFCKTCKRESEASVLHPFPIGFGDNPLALNPERKGGFFWEFFTGRWNRMGMMGGKGFKCPEGHELISVITWFT